MSDVKFCICDVDAERGEGVEVGGLGGERGCISNDYMGLDPDTVDFDTA